MAWLMRVLRSPQLRMKLIHGLRFRLAVSYVAFFAVLLGAIGFIARQNLKNEADSDMRATAEADWGAVKLYLNIKNERPYWIVDETDPEEAYLVERLRHVYLFTDENGDVLEESDTYSSIGTDSPAQIRRILSLPRKEGLPQGETYIRWAKDGTPYMIHGGSMIDEHNHKYFLAIGRSLMVPYRTVDGFTRSYLLLTPIMLALSSMLGWWLAGRALGPVNEVAQAAHNLTGSNLRMKIKTRGADDELDHLIDSFNRMTERLDQSFEQIRRFSTDVSHELRTPLTAIRGQLEVAMFTAETPDQYREAMINALEDVEKLSSIVRALLLLSQAESGQLVLQKAPIDLSDLAAAVVDQFQIPAEEKGVTLTADLETDTVATADRTQMERLISNLLSNALKYTPTGGRVEVRVQPDTNPGWIRLEVKDTGVGISPENLPHIFDRFYRVRNAQTNMIQGLGLGLSFVAWIAEVHGGHVEVESKVGQGSQFTVLLPIGSERPEMPTAERTTAPAHHA